MASPEASVPWKVRARAFATRWAPAMPAVLAGLGVVYVVFGLRPRESLADWYVRKATAAIESKTPDFETANLCYRRLVQLSGSDPRARADYTFREVLMLNAMGRAKSAETLALQLVDDPLVKGQPGLIDAHQWLAGLYLLLAPPSPKTFAAAETHLKVVMGAPSSVSTPANRLLASAWMGHLYAITGQPKRAIPYLEESVAAHPEFLIDLAHSYKSTDDAANADRTAIKSRDAYRKALAEKPDSEVTRINLADAEVMLKQYQPAMATLDAGLKLKDSPQVRKAIVKVAVAWSDSLKLPNGNPAFGDDGARQVEVLGRALQADPGNLEAIDRLMDIAALTATRVDIGVQRRAFAALEAHLKRLKADFPESSTANALLGRFDAMSGQFKEARPLLEACVADRPALLLDLVRTYRGLGETALADKTARTMIGTFTRLTDANPDEDAFRILLADAHTLLDEYKSAVDVIREGQKRKDSPAYKKSLSKVASLWSRSLLLKDGSVRVDPQAPGPRPPRVEILARAVQDDPTNPELAKQLAIILLGNGTPPEREAARSALVAHSANPAAPLEVLDTLAQDAYSRNRFPEARAYWERVRKAQPKIPIVCNNLAWLVGMTEPIDVTRALDLVNDAIRIDPARAMLYRGTRGEILAKAGKLREARDDLKAAIDAKGDQAEPELVKLLKEVDAKLGSPKAAPATRSPG